QRDRLPLCSRLVFTDGWEGPIPHSETGAAGDHPPGRITPYSYKFRDGAESQQMNRLVSLDHPRSTPQGVVEALRDRAFRC
ncbi:MAG TPA: hypothetical protein VMG63_04670, partial [Terriglobia bacterium]|nr:hypothetical protein [Terriglobia bacterium]